MILLTRISDDSYTWTNESTNEITVVLTVSETKAFGNWHYNIAPNETAYVMKYLDSVHSVAEFDEVTKVLMDIRVDFLQK